MELSLQRMVDSVFSWVNPTSSQLCRSPIISVLLLKLLILSAIRKGKTIRNVQARHIPVSPGKEHTVELSGTHISTATNPNLWKLEGECEKKTICGTHFLSMKKIKMWNTFSFNPCRSDANEKSGARQTWMSVLMGGELSRLPSKVIKMVLLTPTHSLYFQGIHILVVDYECGILVKTG